MSGSCERIGVLLVHGIGSQKPNEHLVNEARNIVAALGEQVASITVSTEPAVDKDVPGEFTPDYAKNIVRAEVRLKDGSDKCFEFNEVYWAELGEPPTIVRQVKFWFWALSMWTVAGREHSILPGLKSEMYVPSGDRFKPLYRFTLGFLGALFLLGVGTVGLYNVIADRLKLPRVPISGLLTDYIGDVMLYSQSLREANPEVSEIGQPPRVGIRARMVDALIEFSMRNYDRWYVVAHSLGTVVAHNGLMETEAALPNYLTKARWAAVKASTLFKQLNDDVPALMLPRRPTWLSTKDGIDRRMLFAKLEGLLTYGSAIGKFHGIWPIMVPANKDEYVFPEKFKWINVYDWTDPVAGPLKGFTNEVRGPWDKDANEESAPRLSLVKGGKSAARISENISYKAGFVWLQSHLQYLTYPSAAYARAQAFLVLGLATWLSTGTFDREILGKLMKEQPFEWWRRKMANAEMVVIGLLVWLLTAFLLWKSPAHDALQFLARPGWIATAFGAIASGILFNTVMEMNKIKEVHGSAKLSWLEKLQNRIAERDPPRWLRWVVVIAAIPVGCLAGYLASTCLLVPAGHAIVWITTHVTDAVSGGLQFVLRWVPWVGGALADGVKDTVDAIYAFFDRHVKAVLLSLGLLSITALVIVVLGAVRWLFQPVPTREHPAKATPPPTAAPAKAVP